MRVLLALLTLLAVGAPAHAVSFFPIDAVSSSTAASDLWPASNLIQGPGIGFGAAEPHAKLASGATGDWVTEAPGGFPSDYFSSQAAPVLVFDLGAEVALTEISVWGYTPSNANGVSLFGLRFATESEGPGGFGGSITFAPSYPLLNDGTLRQSRAFGETVPARYVEFTALDNFFVAPGDGSGGDAPGGNRVGLGEVGFAVPEPGSFVIVASGLLVLAARRRRHLDP